MGFEKFGTVNFTLETKASDFITYLEQGKVMATRCTKCDASYFPPRMDCPKCIDSKVEWFEVNKNGKLATYTVVNYGPSGFENDAPYTLALVDFGDGIKMLGRLNRDIAESDIKVGMEVKVVAIKLPGDKVSYEFRKP